MRSGREQACKKYNTAYPKHGCASHHRRDRSCTKSSCERRRAGPWPTWMHSVGRWCWSCFEGRSLACVAEAGDGGVSLGSLTGIVVHAAYRRVKWPGGRCRRPRPSGEGDCWARRGRWRCARRCGRGKNSAARLFPARCRGCCMIFVGLAPVPVCDLPSGESQNRVVSAPPRQH